MAITIDGTPITAPSDYRVDIEPIVKAVRNANAKIIKETIAKKRKVFCTWAFLTTAQIEEILDAIDPEFFSLNYPDPKTNADRTGTFYAGPSSQGGVKYIGGVMTGWKDVSINFIEE